MKVETKRTKPTVAEFCAALRQCAPELSRNAAGVIWSQFATETGRGDFCWNWNIGNVKYSGKGNFTALKGVWEIIGGKRVVLPQSDPGSWFCAYESIDEGMAEHIAFLKNKRYAAVWPKVESRDLVAFAKILKARGYYTAPVADYAHNMVALHTEFMRLAPAWEPLEVDGVLYLPEITIEGDAKDGDA